MLKILLECTKNMFTSKGTWTGESERLKTRPRGESTEKGGARQRHRASIALIKETFSRKTKRLLFCGGGKAIAGRLGAQRKAAKFRKREEQRTVRASLRTEKAKAESFECGSAASGRHKKFRPPPPKLLHSFVAKAQKRQREYFCFCAWFFSTAVGYRWDFLSSEVPFRRILQNKRVRAKSSNGGEQGCCPTAGAEMTGEPKKRRKSKKCRLQPARQSCGTGESGGKKKKPEGFRPIAGFGVRRER